MGTGGHDDIASVLVTGAGPIGLGVLAMARLILGDAVPIYQRCCALEFHRTFDAHLDDLLLAFRAGIEPPIQARAGRRAWRTRLLNRMRQVGVS